MKLMLNLSAKLIISNTNIQHRPTIFTSYMKESFYILKNTVNFQYINSRAILFSQLIFLLNKNNRKRMLALQELIWGPWLDVWLINHYYNESFKTILI